MGEWFNIAPEEAVAYLKSQPEAYELAEPKFVVEVNKKKERRTTNKEYVIQNEYELHLLKTPLTSFKSLGNRRYIKRSTGEMYYIEYKEKQWYARKLKDFEILKQ